MGQPICQGSVTTTTAAETRDDDAATTAGLCPHQQHQHHQRASSATTSGAEAWPWAHAVRAFPSSSPCSICHESLKRNPVRVDCGHRFHDACICAWIAQPNGNARCPVCREGLKIGTLLAAMDIDWAERRLRALMQPLRPCLTQGCRRKEALCNFGFCADHCDAARLVGEGSLDARLWKAVLFYLTATSGRAAEAIEPEEVAGSVVRSLGNLLVMIALSLADVPAPDGASRMREIFHAALVIWKAQGSAEAAAHQLGLWNSTSAALLCSPQVLDQGMTANHH